MEIFLKALQGTYAYVLILQIVIVSMLFLIMLWLLIRRIQEAKDFGDAPVTLSVATAPPVDTAAAGTGHALEEENKNLNEKLHYLESKLLEYEILQEEIGTLSALKVENEQLKARVVQLEGSASKVATAQSISGVSEEIATKAPEPPPSDESRGVPLNEETNRAEPTTLGAPKESGAAAGDGDLDGLLNQIDALTAETAPAPEKQI